MKVNPVSPISLIKQYFTNNDNEDNKKPNQVNMEEEQEQSEDWYEPSFQNDNKFLYNNKGILYADEEDMIKKSRLVHKAYEESSNFVMVIAPMYGDPQSYSEYVNQNQNNEMLQEVKQNKRHKFINRVKDWIDKHMPDAFTII